MNEMPALLAVADPTDPAPRSREELLRHLREGWGSSIHISPTLLIVLGLVLAIAAGAVLGVRLWRHHRMSRQASATFRRAARQAGLSRRDRRLLGRVAARAGLQTPLTLLLSPATLRHHAADLPRFARHAARIEMLLRSLDPPASLTDEQG